MRLLWQRSELPGLQRKQQQHKKQRATYSHDLHSPVSGESQTIVRGETSPVATSARLLDEFLTAVSEYLLLESQIEAEKRGEVPHAQIAAAWLRKEDAKQAAIEHRIEHGC